ncbi:MAG: hypothetical protein PVI37_01585 [Gammaproteobacteria bacterium]|jgi:hypothetical protein
MNRRKRKKLAEFILVNGMLRAGSALFGIAVLINLAAHGGHVQSSSRLILLAGLSYGAGLVIPALVLASQFVVSALRHQGSG